MIDTLLKTELGWKLDNSYAHLPELFYSKQNPTPVYSPEHNDCTVFEKLPNILSNPYAHTPEQFEYASPPEPSCSPYQTFCGT